MDTLCSIASNKQVHDQQQSQVQQRTESTSPKRSRSECQQDLANASTIHTRRRLSLVGRLHIDTKQPLPQDHLRLNIGPYATKQKTTTGPNADVTRRRQWSQTMLDVLQDLSLVLSPEGTIVWVPRTAKALLGYEPERLVNERMADLIRPDEVAHFVHHLHESVDQQADFYHYYHIRKADGEYSCLEISGRPHYEEVKDPVSGGRMHVLRSFFLSARPHPSRAAQALDTFFEIKRENEVLRQKLKDLGVRQEELSEMAEHGGRSRQTCRQSHLSRDGRAGRYGDGREGESKQSSLQHWQQNCQRSVSPVARAQTTASFETILGQNVQWHQNQQTQHQAALRPHQHPIRDSPTMSDASVNAFLCTEDIVSDMSAEQDPETLRAFHDTASYFYAVADQSPVMPNAARDSSEDILAPDARSAVHDPCYVSYSKLAHQQQHHVPPSQDFYPFGSPEPFPYGLYGTTAYTESSPFIAPGVLPQRRTPIPMQPQLSQQQQQPTLGPPMSRPSPRHAPVQLSHASRNAGSDGEALRTPHMLPSQALNGSNMVSSMQTGSHTLSSQQQTADARTMFPRSSEIQARAAMPATVQTTATTAQQPSSNHAHARSLKKLKKSRAGGSEYVCTDCGTNDSPEWRRGPRGAKTLCNACGLRFAKLQKKAGGVQQMGMQPRTDTCGHSRHSSASTIASK